jgi:hypothetical protein
MLRSAPFTRETKRKDAFMTATQWGLIFGMVGVVLAASTTVGFVRDKGVSVGAVSWLGFMLEKLGWERMARIAERCGSPLGWSLIFLGFLLQFLDA